MSYSKSDYKFLQSLKLEKNNDIKYISFSYFWNNWSTSLMISAIGLSIFLVLLIMMNFATAIYNSNVLVTNQDGNWPSMINPIPVGPWFSGTSYEFWLIFGRVITWGTLLLSLLFLILSLYLFKKKNDFKKEIIGKIYEGYKPKDDIDKMVLANYLGILHYNIERK